MSQKVDKFVIADKHALRKKRKLFYTKSGFGVKEISKEIGIKKNLSILLKLIRDRQVS